METNELIKEAENLFNQQKFKEVISLLTDSILKEKNNAELFAWRARASHRLNNDTILSSIFADKAIEVDPTYFMGYFVKACVYDEKKEYESALKYYSDALEQNPSFAEAYLRRSIIRLRKKEKENAIDDNEKAIEYYNLAVKVNPNVSELYLWKGIALYNKEDYDNAIKSYSKAIKLKSDYAFAYYNRGLTWFVKKKYDKAIDDYTKAIEYDSDFEDTYFVDRGNAWFSKKNYDEAIANYNNAIIKNPSFENAYYCRGLARKEEGSDLKGSKDDFVEYLKLTGNKSEVSTKYAKYYIEYLEEKISDPHLSSIRQLVNEIKDMLLIKEECVHFTTLTTLKKLILEKSKFRLSEGNFMNDPSEGKEFYDYLEYQPFIACINSSLIENFSPKPFIGSFVTKNKYDDLNMWRFYGKEKGEEAKGCSITLCTKEFIDDINNSLSNEKKEARIDNESDINFYRVVYLQKGKKFYIPDSKIANKLEKLMGKLKQNVKLYNGENKISLERYLNNIAFLFKSDAFKNENEVRLVVKGIEIDKKYNMDLTPPQVYIELVPIKELVRRITLGPKVEKVNEWASAFYYIYESNAPEIIISHKPYK